jgi:hypothetical protein
VRSIKELKTVDEILAVHDRHDGEYENRYRHGIFCPEYLAASLTFVPNAQTPYLRTKSGTEYCSEKPQ